MHRTDIERQFHGFSRFAMPGFMQGIPVFGLSMQDADGRNKSGRDG
jgi:hypothetical protein